MTSCSPPVASAAAIAPSFEDWLNDLSSSCPTSVTTPTLSGVRAADADGATDASTDGAGLVATDGAAVAADGALVAAPGPQAATKMARPANRVRPMRFCMCPPLTWPPAALTDASGATRDPVRPLLPGRHRLRIVP